MLLLGLLFMLQAVVIFVLIGYFVITSYSIHYTKLYDETGDVRC